MLLYEVTDNMAHTGERDRQAEEGDLQVMAGLWYPQGRRQLPAAQVIYVLGCH